MPRRIGRRDVGIEFDVLASLGDVPIDSTGHARQERCAESRAFVGTIALYG